MNYLVSGQFYKVKQDSERAIHFYEHLKAGEAKLLVLQVSVLTRWREFLLTVRIRSCMAALKTREKKKKKEE